MSKLIHTTLAEQAYEELLSQILSGHRRAGQLLLPDRIADEFSISQTPVKEALALLARDGLIGGKVRRTSAVRRFTYEDIIHIYEARSLLEVTALSEGARANRITQDVLDGLQDLHQAQQCHVLGPTRGRVIETLRYERQFHGGIVALSGNDVMIGWHRTVLLQIQTIRAQSLDACNTPQNCNDHGAILEALKRGNLADALRVLRLDINGSRDQVASRALRDSAQRQQRVERAQAYQNGCKGLFSSHDLRLAEIEPHVKWEEPSPMNEYDRVIRR